MATDAGLDLRVDAGLPIAAKQAEIAALLLGHQVVIVAGETGSGKTTQLPKICLALGRTSIGHAQPRRIAARSVATRIAAELGTPLGQVVGYQVRFEAKAQVTSSLLVMTDGILLSQIAHDPWLRRYDTIIIDEAHERSLNIDFLLGYIKQLLPKRPDLKVIVTSATIDTDRFSQYFGCAPIVEVSGRGYPIEVRYEPLGAKDQADAIVTALRGLPQDWDTLVFLAGEREIRDAAAAVEAARLRDTAVLPLYSRLTMAEQARVFAPHTGRRVVLATNVAETSLTVPGVRCVIDPGFARISRYSARTKVQRLPIEPISQASANQRAGRCGRVAPGVCVRLYSEEDYLARPAFTTPEMLRTNLASVILAMARANLGEVADFDFIDAPDARNVADGVRLLNELGAIRQTNKGLRLTGVGRRLADLPIDPALARIVLEGNIRGCLREAIIVAAGWSVPDVRERPLDHRDQADAAHARFASDQALALSQQPDQAEQDAAVAQPSQPARITVHTGWGAFRGRKQTRANQSQNPPGDVSGGDIAAMLRLWRYLGDAQRDLSANQFRKLCQKEFLSYLRVREWQDLASQLKVVARGMKMHAKADDAPIDDVLRAVLAGMVSHIGALEAPAVKARGPKQYLGARGAHFAIAPDSVLARREPPLVLAVELVETSRLWAHGVAAIEPEWAEQAGASFLRRRYSQPVFSAKARRVVATEHASLFGVPLGGGRIVDYGVIDLAGARAVFIQAGLVEGQLTARPDSPLARVLAHNQSTKDEVEQWEVKSRRRGLALDDVSLAAWFDVRLPAQVVSGASLDAWLKGSSKNEAALMLESGDLLMSAPPAVADYPDRWVFGDTSLPLNYRFDPGHNHDGVTVAVPLGLLASLADGPFSWGVPGQRLELATALIRGLPRSARRHVVPAAAYAYRALDWLEVHGDQSRAFCDELGRALTAMTGQTGWDWQIDSLPNHLRVGFSVDDGQQVRVAKDLASLQNDVNDQVRASLTKATRQKARSGTSWVFGDLAKQVLLRRGQASATAYPALQDTGAGVLETFVTNLDQAKQVHRQGVIRLLALSLPDPSKGLLAHLSAADLSVLATGPYSSTAALLADARDGAIGELLDGSCEPWEVRSEAGIAKAIETVRIDQVTAMRQIVHLAVAVLGRLGRLEMTLARFDQTSAMVADITSQLDDLVFEGFLHAIAPQWLARVPVWLDGVAKRIDSSDKDAQRRGEIGPVLDAYAALVAAHPGADKQIDQIGFLIEELRLQIFAQPMRTIQPVSVKRLLAAIQVVGRG